MQKLRQLKGAILLLLLAGLFCFQSCENDEENNYYWAQDVGVLTPTDLAGIVKDRYGNPLAGVLITSHHLTAISNHLGFFSIPDSWAIRGRVQLKMEKTGYFDGFYAGPIQGEKTIFNLILSRTFEKSFSSTEETILQLSASATVQFPSNGFATSDGTAYSGLIKAKLKHFDPRDPNFSYLMPGGDFRGIDEYGDEMLLISYGAIAVELASPSGEEIQLAEGYTALIELEVPETMLADAPSTIPLWHFNEETAIWEEEGFATLESSKYVGEVSHFSFWNIDRPVSDRSFVSGYVKDCNGLPLANVPVQVGPLIVYSNENGFYESNVAIDLAFDVGFVHPNDIHGTATIAINNVFDGEYLELEDLISTFCPTYLAGEIQDCEENEISDGYIIINWPEGSKIALFSDGSFNIPIPNSTDFIISVITTNFTGEISYTSSDIVDNYSLPDPIQLCNELSCSFANYISPTIEVIFFEGTTEFGTTWVPFNAEPGGINNFSNGIPNWTELNFAKIFSEDKALTIFYNTQGSGIFDLKEVPAILNINFPIYLENPELSLVEWAEQWEVFENPYWLEIGEINLNFNTETELEIFFDGLPYSINSIYGLAPLFSFENDDYYFEGSACFDLSE